MGEFDTYVKTYLFSLIDKEFIEENGISTLLELFKVNNPTSYVEYQGPPIYTLNDININYILTPLNEGDSYTYIPEVNQEEELNTLVTIEISVSINQTPMNEKYEETFLFSPQLSFPQPRTPTEQTPIYL